MSFEIKVGHNSARGLDCRVLDIEAEVYDGCNFIPGGLVTCVGIAVAAKEH